MHTTSRQSPRRGGIWAGKPVAARLCRLGCAISGGGSASQAHVGAASERAVGGKTTGDLRPGQLPPPFLLPVRGPSTLACCIGCGLVTGRDGAPAHMLCTAKVARLHFQIALSPSRRLCLPRVKETRFWLPSRPASHSHPLRLYRLERLARGRARLSIAPPPYPPTVRTQLAPETLHDARAQLHTPTPNTMDLSVGCDHPVRVAGMCAICGLAVDDE